MRTGRYRNPVCTENLDSDVVVMKSAQASRGKSAGEVRTATRIIPSGENVVASRAGRS
jgi:hypothetical protein